MEFRKLGRTGLNVSCIGFGGAPMGINNYLEAYDARNSRGNVEAALHTALDQGINYIDTAPGYGQGLGESIIGEVLKTRRTEAYIATKVASSLGYDEVKRSVDASLQRLQSEYIDVMQFHGGYLTEGDYKRLIHDGPLDALKECQKQGKIRFIGITNENPDHTLLWAIQSGHFDVIQVRYNLFYQGAADPLIPEAASREVGVVVMRPLTSQAFARFMKRVAPEAAEKLNTQQIALDFVLSNPGVSVAICGMRTSDEVLDNVRSVQKQQYRMEFKLDRGQGGVQF
ncbi:aldo/keto reductase [Paenibacillus allorhizosphaerae]|uniref:Aldo-keto reductase IolS n=1 Tax=Paenibacillus allorhizosphaerae TaxID=2849866 RepID=A0ABM8VPA0_9BACL|nr:aldo/keto reductase [Paenibacillus allorhizosphaerae]CAG7652559.1 Aldo-keto reductase IolS [Paenibacillus allorhizosphaerae]